MICWIWNFQFILFLNINSLENFFFARYMRDKISKLSPVKCEYQASSNSCFPQPLIPAKSIICFQILQKFFLMLQSSILFSLSPNNFPSRILVNHYLWDFLEHFDKTFHFSEPFDWDAFYCAVKLQSWMWRNAENKQYEQTSIKQLSEKCSGCQTGLFTWMKRKLFDKEMIWLLYGK